MGEKVTALTSRKKGDFIMRNPGGVILPGSILAIWNRDRILIVDSGGTTRANGQVGFDINIIEDVQLQGSNIVVFGRVEGINDCTYGAAILNTSTWTWAASGFAR